MRANSSLRKQIMLVRVRLTFMGPRGGPDALGTAAILKHFITLSVYALYGEEIF